jgi:outer membrane protein TolC
VALRKRADYDVYVIQLNQTTSQIQLQESRFIELVNNIRSAEVALKALMNDPVLNQSVDMDIIPTDLPTFEPLVLDLLGELSAALSYRSELQQARLTIEQAQIGIGVAKNQALPKLDLLFRYIVDGLGSNADTAFGQMADNKFNEYVVGLQFEWPIGNRGPEAALRRARLQQAQAIAAHRGQIEGVLAEVKETILDLESSYAQINPNYRAARASFDQLDAIRRKQETRSPANLQVELSANQDLASARLGLLQALVNYNINIIDLERRKGTLLRFNNVTIAGAEDEGSQKPYRPSSSGWDEHRMSAE